MSESKAEVAPLLLTHPFQLEELGWSGVLFLLVSSVFTFRQATQGDAQAEARTVWRGSPCIPVWHPVGAGLLLQEGAGRRDGTAPPLPHCQKLWEYKRPSFLMCMVHPHHPPSPSQ